MMQNERSTCKICKSSIPVNPHNKNLCHKCFENQKAIKNKSN